MKKINKNQKLVILIAIATMIIIIGAVICANIIKTNIANEKYNSSNGASNNGNLLPEYIKKGITLGGVTGTLEDLDTSDATARPEDIAYGKTAYVNGVKITGTYEEKVPDLNKNNTEFTQDIDYWTNKDVNVYVNTTVSGYTLQLAVGDPNEENNWHNATSEIMKTNGTIYARLTNGRKSGGWTSYDVTNIDKTPPFANPKGTMTISRYGRGIYGDQLEPYQASLIVNNIYDNESGVEKLVFYYKSDAQDSYTRSEDKYFSTNYGTFSYKANFSESDFNGHTIYMYVEIYDVAGNIAKSYMASITADGYTSYNPQ